MSGTHSPSRPTTKVADLDRDNPPGDTTPNISNTQEPNTNLATVADALTTSTNNDNNASILDMTPIPGVDPNTIKQSLFDQEASEIQQSDSDSPKSSSGIRQSSAALAPISKQHGDQQDPSNVSQINFSSFSNTISGPYPYWSRELKTPRTPKNI